MSKPGFYFYTGDWLKNTRTISMQARGAWIDLLCYMDEKRPRGKMKLNVQQYAILLGCSAEIAGGILVELETEGVADISPSLLGVTFASRVTACDFFVTVKCRRMLREENNKESHRIRQQRYRERRSSDKPVTPPLPSPSPSPSLLISKKDTATPNGFADFWSLYPKKKSKGQAEKAWAAIKVTPELLATIMRGVAQAKRSQSWLKDGGQYIPHPATWLRAKGWEDQEYVSLAPPKPTLVPKVAEPQERKPTPEEAERTQELLRKLAERMKA